MGYSLLLVYYLMAFFTFLVHVFYFYKVAVIRSGFLIQFLFFSPFLLERNKYKRLGKYIGHRLNILEVSFHGIPRHM